MRYVGLFARPALFFLLTTFLLKRVDFLVNLCDILSTEGSLGWGKAGEDVPDVSWGGRKVASKRRSASIFYNK
jgi:hypothetical protein